MKLRCWIYYKQIKNALLKRIVVYNSLIVVQLYLNPTALCICCCMAHCIQQNWIKFIQFNQL
jgi:hypothetical protein